MILLSQCLKFFGYVRNEVDFENDVVPAIDLKIVNIANSIIQELVQTQDEYTKIFESRNFFCFICEILVDENERDINKEINEFINSKLK